MGVRARLIRTQERLLRFQERLDRSIAVDSAAGAGRLLREGIRHGDDRKLDKSVRLLREALAAGGPDHPDRARWLSDLGLALQDQSERTPGMPQLDEAIELMREAVTTARETDPNRCKYLSNLGGALWLRFEWDGGLEILGEAIETARAALVTAPADHADRPSILANLSIFLLTRYERADGLPYLDESIELARAAVAASAQGHPDHALRLSALSITLRRRFERAGERPDLDEAVERARAAVAASAVRGANHPKYLTNLSNLLWTRAAWDRSRADLDEAVERARAALAATPEDHTSRPMYLSNLSTALQARFDRTAVLQDLDEGVEAAREAVAACPVHYPDRAMYLSNLGNRLWSRFEHNGALADLNQAVEAGRAAVAATPTDHANLATHLSNLGIALSIRSARTESQQDLDEAVETDRAAVSATPEDHGDRALYLTNLSTTLLQRSASAANASDLDDAVEAARAAVAASPLGGPGLAGHSSNLGICLQARFERTGERGDLDEAAETIRAAVAATPDGHPDRALYLSNLGDTLRLRFDRFRARQDLDEARNAYQDAARVESATPRRRAAAARRWGLAAATDGRWDEAVRGFTLAVEFLGLVAPRSLARDDQEHLLEDFGGLATDAAVCCVHAGRWDLAVELFEQGRGVLLGQALDTRTDLTALRARHPALASRFVALRDELDQADSVAQPSIVPGADAGAGTDGVDAADLRAVWSRRRDEQRRELVEAFGKIVTEIRASPDFGDFLRPWSVHELAAVSTGGHVVIVAISAFGSYALIVSGGEVQEPVPLPRLNVEAVEERVAAFVDDRARSHADSSSSRQAEQRLSDTLRWLWDDLASSVLARLGLTAAPEPGEPWPRVWWCPSGPVSLLPLHAAGRHDMGSGIAESVITRAISSYTPTLRALAYSRRVRSQRSAGDSVSGALDSVDGHVGDVVPRVLAVAMPTTPDEPDLPGAASEADDIRSRFPSALVLTGNDASRTSVLTAMRSAPSVHFSCHAQVDPLDPSASKLLLADHQQRPLTVVDVARLRLEDAHLAFLAACSTAQSPRRLTDEAIHLASAFQLAGYRHVIGTLWPVNDVYAARITRRVYDGLAAGEGVANAVHDAALRMLQEQYSRPSAWASHIHAGP